MNLDIDKIRTQPQSTLVIGNHRPIIQSMLDFDFLCGKKQPGVGGVVGSGGRFQKYFWGNGEVLIPCFQSAQQAATELGSVGWMVNVMSGRRSYASTVEFFQSFPDALGGHLFAEDIPEVFALKLLAEYQDKGKVIIGTAGVGLIIPGSLKLGAIGGTDWRQIQHNRLTKPGNIAILSASGGMINEIITMVCQGGHSLSFGLCFGGDRFPATSPREAFLAAEADPRTAAIVYYGELGGQDEYEVVELLKAKAITKPVVCYIAGIIAESLAQPVQFGHAKALARLPEETASAKSRALAEVGAKVAGSIVELAELITSLPAGLEPEMRYPSLATRTASMFTSTISRESEESEYSFVGRTLTDWASEGDFTKQIVSGLLGRQPRSTIIVEFTTLVFILGIDHGPQVAGTLNTIVTARAGKNMVDSLIAGLTTIGPRFGGAVSGAADEWFSGVSDKLAAGAFVESRARQSKQIMGIGHKKYRIGLPDPRTAEIEKFATKLEKHLYLDYARSVEAVTSAKKGSLILNIDGWIAALLLDILEQTEEFSPEEIRQLIDADFFNAFFIIPRSVGFISHYLDQKRLDEGLFRLPDGLVHME